MKPARTSFRPHEAPIRRPRAAAGLALAALAAASLAIGCSRSPLERALARGAAWFETHVAQVDPSWASVLGYLHRRFDFSLRLASGELAHAARGGSARPGIAELYRRLDDPDARVDPRSIAALPSQTDRMTALALHCDQLGLPERWPELLRNASLAGGYALTHAALARAWTLENGCLPAHALAPLAREQGGLLAALVARADARADPRQPTTDQWIEALALLYYTGERERVRPEWIAALLAAQRPDGGWALTPDAPRSHPHPTALALWVLLENLEPEAAAIRWIPARRDAIASP